MNVPTTTATSAASSMQGLLESTGFADASLMAIIFTQLEQLDSANQKINELVSGLDRNSRLQKAIKQHMSDLQKLKAMIVEQDKDGKVGTRKLDSWKAAKELIPNFGKLPAHLQNHPDAGKMRQELMNKQYAQFQQKYLTKVDFVFDSKTGAMKQVKSGGFSSHEAALEQELERLKSTSDALSNDNQKMTLFLQHHLQMQEKTKSFVSNMLKSAHNADMAVIRKIG